MGPAERQRARVYTSDSGRAGETTWEANFEVGYTVSLYNDALRLILVERGNGGVACFGPGFQREDHACFFDNEDRAMEGNTAG